MTEKFNLKKWPNLLKDEDGLTLIELLAVIVILGIIAVIAILSITSVIDRSRQHAIVSNAYVLRDAGNLYAKQHTLSGSQFTNEKISYKLLIEEGYLEQVVDPDSRDEWDIDNGSYVTIEQDRVKAVCLKGDKRSLCYNQEGNEGIRPTDLKINLVTNNE